MAGSLRYLPSGNIQLRVYIGTDQATGRQLVRTRTITTRSKRAANQELARFVAELDPLRQNSDAIADRTMADRHCCVEGSAP